MRLFFKNGRSSNQRKCTCGHELLIEGVDRFSRVSFKGRGEWGSIFLLGESYATLSSPPSTTKLHIAIFPFVAQILKETHFCQELLIVVNKWLRAKQQLDWQYTINIFGIADFPSKELFATPRDKIKF